MTNFALVCGPKVLTPSSSRDRSKARGCCFTSACLGHARPELSASPSSGLLTPSGLSAFARQPQGLLDRIGAGSAGNSVPVVLRVSNRFEEMSFAFHPLAASFADEATLPFAVSPARIFNKASPCFSTFASPTPSISRSAARSLAFFLTI